MRMTQIAVAAAFALLVPGVALAGGPQKNYNGTWSVRLVTEAGSCDASYHTTIQVEDGQVRPVSGGASVSGGISSDGSVALGIQRSIASGHASGRLAARSGSGTWQVSMLGCTGRWTAQRMTLTAQN